MIPPKCFSCGKPLAHIQVPWEQGVDAINADTKLSDTEKEEKRRELFATLGIDRYCCKTRVMGYIDQVNLIN